MLAAFAPIVAPTGIADETGGERALSNPGSPTIANAGDLATIGIATIPPAPPVAPQPKTAVRLHSGIKAPQRLVNVTPVYPVIARSAQVQGVVIIEATLDERGNVVRAEVLRSIPLLDAAALDAVRQWKFTPTS
jgi:protein TonB